MRLPIQRHIKPIKLLVRSRSRSVSVKAFDNDAMYYAGKSVILFVGFYAGLQWLYYKTMREKYEKDRDQKK